MATTTEALNNRTERHVWMDILIAKGGTVGFNDTIPQLERKTALALGAAYNCCSRPTEYRMLRFIYTALTGIPAPNLGKNYMEALAISAAEGGGGNLLLNTGGELQLNTGEPVILD